MLKAMTISSNKELLPGIEAIDKSNENLVMLLDPLTEQPYFRYYSVDILASCEYMPQELFECYTQSCEIYPEDAEAVSVDRTSGRLYYLLFSKPGTWHSKKCPE